MLDSCLRDVSVYFDAFNAPRILINEERRKEREEQQEEDNNEGEESEENPTEEEEPIQEVDYAELYKSLDTLQVILYPNVIRRQNAQSELNFRFQGSWTTELRNSYLNSITLIDLNGRQYLQVREREWSRQHLGQIFAISKLTPGYYFVIFELANGRKISKPLILQ